MTKIINAADLEDLGPGLTPEKLEEVMAELDDRKQRLGHLSNEDIRELFKDQLTDDQFWLFEEYAGRQVEESQRFHERHVEAIARHLSSFETAIRAVSSHVYESMDPATCCQVQKAAES